MSYRKPKDCDKFSVRKEITVFNENLKIQVMIPIGSIGIITEIGRNARYEEYYKIFWLRSDGSGAYCKLSNFEIKSLLLNGDIKFTG